jgi:hypothetical protein
MRDSAVKIGDLAIWNKKQRFSNRQQIFGFLFLVGAWALFLIGSAMVQTSTLAKTKSGILIGESGQEKRLIYFAGSIRGGRQDAALYRSLIDHIRSSHGRFACVMLILHLIFDM